MAAGFQVLTVTQLCRYVKSLLEEQRQLGDVLVKGEVTNLAYRQSSGHLYFSIRDGHVLVTAGRLTRQKGQWHLIRAVSILKKEIKNIKLVIFGDGEMLDDLQEYTETLGVSDCVFFPGYMKNYHYFMKKCDAFVFSSLYEGFGNVLIEALACGLPIVSVDAKYGPREILSDSNHLVSDMELAEYGIITEEISRKTFDKNDIDFERGDYSLAKGISVLLKDEKKRMYYVAQAKKRSKDFLPDKVISQRKNVIG